MGTNNRERRAAKRRKQLQARKTAGPLPPEELPFDVDEPPFDVQCPECGEVTDIPLHVAEVAADELPLAPAEFMCPICGKSAVEVAPRIVHAGGKKRLALIDRQAFEASGIKEWSPTFNVLAFEAEKDGETFTVATGRSGRAYWAICDECGLPFEHIGESAVATTADSQAVVELLVGPCKHCNGVGRPVLARANDGSRKIVANSPEFANGLLLALAEQLRAGELDPLEVAAELRTQGTPVLTRIADWIESRPATTAAATTAICAVLGIAATLLAPQMTDDDAQPDPHTYTEQQVEQIVETIIDSYEQRQPARPPNRDADPGANTGTVSTPETSKVGE